MAGISGEDSSQSHARNGNFSLVQEAMDVVQRLLEFTGVLVFFIWLIC